MRLQMTEPASALFSGSAAVDITRQLAILFDFHHDRATDAGAGHYVSWTHSAAPGGSLWTAGELAIGKADAGFDFPGGGYDLGERPSDGIGSAAVEVTGISDAPINMTVISPAPTLSQMDAAVVQGGVAALEALLFQGDDDMTLKGGRLIAHGHGGNDEITVRDGAALVYGDAGNDLLDVFDINANPATITQRSFGGSGNDTVDGSVGRDTVLGGSGNDSLLGRGGNDVLKGEAGADFIDGDNGADTITGGAGADLMAAGNNDATRDVFVFAARSDSGAAGAAMDRITEFNGVGAKGDVIDLRLLDANATRGGNQAFVAEADGTFDAGQKGQAVLVAQGANRVLRLDFNGDRVADMAIVIVAPVAVGFADILL